MVNNQISVAPRKRRGAIIWVIIGILVLILGFGGCSSYNSMNSLSHDVDQAWAQVQVQYQRRSDLIPNLVNAVKGYASHESEVFQKVTAARAGLLSADEAAKQVANTEAPVNQEQLQGYMNRQDQLQKAMGLYINAVREAYPDLKANTQFLDLQTQLEGTENRIATERGRYTDVVRQYNVKITGFPAVIFAKLFGFDKRPQFQASEEAQAAPSVQF